MTADDVVIRMQKVRKDYHSLRPLRVERLEVRQGQTLAILGFDRAAAEVLVNLITAATLPDAGELDIFGTPTRAITNPDQWFQSLDSFGIFSERVVLMDELTVEQNLALPISFEIDNLSPDVRRQVALLATEVGIAVDECARSMGAATATTRARVRLAKALALRPRVLLAEHPNAALPPDEVPRLAATLASVAHTRNLATLVLTSDVSFARQACAHVLTWRPATGEIVRGGWRSWFGQT